jgi:hypothetical protein
MELMMIKVGEKDGLPIFSPFELDDVKAIGSKEYLCCNLKSAKSLRTSLQNRSLHLYFKNLANALNDSGNDMKVTLSTISDKPEIPWSMLSVKERLWQPVMDSIINQKSTARMEKKDVSIVYDALNRVLINRLGVSVQFPERSQLFES